jgi:hypothetical protein
MEETPEGTPVGVDDPYAFAGICDHLTDDGRCRFALERAGDDPDFAARRRVDDYRCHVGADGDWRACPHYRSTTDGRACRRCGLEERRIAHDDARPLIEEHHLSYGGSADGRRDAGGESGEDGEDDPAHEITVALCRWCHAKVHGSFVRIDDDASPDAEAIAAREERRGREQSELGFDTARERYDQGGTDAGSGGG